ncbi:phosphate transporter [Cenococcum geophilum 1.58]|uniref:phosphate transporter n=1 Tax=Cenococcum geophilum 1.58 TaxID=794803 RepID=UPI00358F50FC|nr:phosphate transporter [Cenococcum geophilum 1.58]
MAALHQYDYLFAIGTIFAFLAAWNIGANDAANSFATSVSSRSLTMKQAMLIATCMEFTGSMAVDTRVSETIRTKIISTKLFAQEPSVLMLGMVCAVIGSSLYLTAATRLGLPVSTTHSIMGGIIGVGIASVGAHVFAAWAIAPGITGAFGTIIFLITKYEVMLRKNPVKKAFITVPIYFATTSGLLTMSIVWKGASSKIKLKDGEIAGVIVGVAAGVALLIRVFLLPYLYRKLVLGDWQLQWWHILQGPLLLRLGEIPPRPEGVSDVQDYYRGHLTKEELEAKQAQEGNSDDVEKHPNVLSSAEENSSSSDVVASNSQMAPRLGNSLWPIAVLHGVEKDVVSAQSKSNILTGNLEEMHARAENYDNKAEYAYSFLQIMIAATASFTHGANDVSK